MITKYTEYIKESSTFNKLGFPKKFIEEFYNQFIIINNNFEIKKLDQNILELLQKTTYKFINKSFIYFDILKKEYLVFRFYDTYSVDFVYCYMDEIISENIKVDLFTKNYLKNTDVNNWYEIVNSEIEYNWDYYDTNQKGERYKKINQETDIEQFVIEKFEWDYSNLFKKLFKSYLEIIKKHFSENILNITDVDVNNPNDELRYYVKIKEDFELLLNLISNPLYMLSSNWRIYSNSIKQLYKKYNVKITTVKEEFDFVKQHLQELSNECAKYYYKEVTKDLYFLNLKRWNKELEINPSFWNDIKDNIFDKKLKDKWKHLDNASNFDLI